ncbi:hypothetical protein JCM17960_27620 [Magnetospira thiophila]
MFPVSRKASPSSFRSGRPGNATARPKLDQWFKNTFPGTVDLASGQSASGTSFFHPDDRKQIDAGINAGLGARVKAGMPTPASQPQTNGPSMGDDGQWYGPDGNKIDNPNRDLNVQNAQAAPQQPASQSSNRKPPQLMAPVPGGTIRPQDGMGDGRYGASRDGGKRKHTGVDFVAKPGQDVVSTVDGTVTKLG